MSALSTGSPVTENDVPSNGGGFDFVDPGPSAVDEMRRLLECHREDNGCIPSDLAVSLRRSLHEMGHCSDPLCCVVSGSRERNEVRGHVLGELVGLEERRLVLAERQESPPARPVNPVGVSGERGGVPVMVDFGSMPLPSAFLYPRDPVPRFTAFLFPWRWSGEFAGRRASVRDPGILGPDSRRGAGRRGRFARGLCPVGVGRVCPYARPTHTGRGRFHHSRVCQGY